MFSAICFNYVEKASAIKWIMKKFLLMILSVFLFACSKSYNAGLYKDGLNKDNLLAIFPSAYSLEVAMENCQSTADLFRADDAKNGNTSVVTGEAPVYYCQQVNA